MKKLRIVFMGTPDFAVENLEAILDANHEVVAVITAPDKPAGRGLKINKSAVKICAEKNNLPIWQPENLKDAKFISELRRLQPDVQVVVAFRMLPKIVWSIAPTFNLHASLLPDYRGAAPIHWAVINGEEKTGVTTFLIDEKIDTGAIILQEETPIKPKENMGSVYKRLMKMGSKLTIKTLNLLVSESRLKTTKQVEENGHSAPKLCAENCSIDWQEDINVIYNKIRGLNPFPIAKTTLYNGGKKTPTKIFEAAKITAHHTQNIGAILRENKMLKVAVKGGFIIIKILQIAGKKKMKTKEFLNGFSLQNDAKFL